MPKRLTKSERGQLRVEIGTRLRALRKSSGFSRIELSDYLNLTVGHVGLIERGERGLTAEMLVNISILLNCSTDYLLTGREHCAFAGEGRHVSELDRLLNENSKQKLAEFIRTFTRHQRRLERANAEKSDDE
ncbi:MAG: helix-turn-helix domain-containing protein [Defluviitaleaceae bacterium]|nr:helix-turn-helix domain-containing protein [Defluviitaleaceae bacterium]